jgi:hypothetical protein
VEVPQPTLTALREHRACFMLGEVCEDLPSLEIRYHRADRNAEHDIRRGTAEAVGTLALCSVLGAMNTRVAIVDERIDVAVGYEVYAATTAAVAAIGSSAWHKFLSPETRDAIAAFAGVQLDHSFVNEFHNFV